MSYIADLHIHSRFSRATSKESHLPGLAAWAAVKGIQVVGTGDFTHPGWFAHLVEHLEPAEPGFFRLRHGHAAVGGVLPEGLAAVAAPGDVRFVLTAEISSIYKRGGRVRKVHNLLYVPDLDSVRRLNATLTTMGNIASDGRPILGLDSRDLLEILLEQAPEGFLVPAHVWTPWFSLFGSKSGFDSIEECFGDLSSHIFALETGLSSDPEMNRLIAALDPYTLISNSDCHSPAKLGREANVLDTEFDFFALREALRRPMDADGRQRFAATVEFYPEEGKYHCDGHRKCGVCLQPTVSRQHANLCPVCGKPLTIGVLHRIMELADRSQPVFPAGSPAVHSLVPLPELLAELLDCGPASKKVMAGYVRLIREFGSDFQLLLATPLEEIRSRGFALLAEAIKRVRDGRVIRQPGYDGEFGVIRVFSEGERAELCGQGRLFGAVESVAGKRRRARVDLMQPVDTRLVPAPTGRGLNAEQRLAVASKARLILVQAGPGTGKTHTLVHRVLRLVESSEQPCTVITFTNKAAAEVRERLGQSLDLPSRVTVSTFHGYCLGHLRRFQPGLRVVGPEERAVMLEELFPDWPQARRQTLSRGLSARLGRGPALGDEAEMAIYLEALAKRSLIDIEAVVGQLVQLLRQGGAAAESARAATGHLLVDEFQDVNAMQYELVTLLAETTTVFAIGDPDQAIYGFRGADPSWFHAFLDQFQAEHHQLVRNYRSGEHILQAAGHLIARNPHPRPLAPMRPCRAASGYVHLQACTTPEQEAVFVADQIELQVGGTTHRNLERLGERTGSVSFREIGVLYRTSRQAEAIGRVLTERSIPFQLVHLEAAYTKGDCRLLYASLLLLAGLADETQALFLLGREPGLGRHGLRLAKATLRSRPAAAGPGLGPADLPAMAGAAGQVVEHWRAWLRGLGQLGAAQGPTAVLAELIQRYRLDPLQTDIVQLQAVAHSFSTVAALAAHLLEFSDSIVYDARAEAVALSTLHAAKGLEFAVVFLAGLEEELLPLAPHEALAEAALQAHLQEERRLCYVGMTRAMDTLYLSWCARRALPGQAAGAVRQPSRFLAELPSELLTPSPQVGTASVKRKNRHRQLSLFS